MRYGPSDRICSRVIILGQVPSVAERMAKAVGFRNTAVHAYQEIDWQIVFIIITKHLGDFREFARQVLEFID